MPATPTISSRPFDDLLNLVFGEIAAFAEGEGDVFADGEGVEERAILEDHGDFAADGLHLLLVVIRRCLRQRPGSCLCRA